MHSRTLTHALAHTQLQFDVTQTTDLQERTGRVDTGPRYEVLGLAVVAGDDDGEAFL